MFDFFHASLICSVFNYYITCSWRDDDDDYYYYYYYCISIAFIWSSYNINLLYGKTGFRMETVQSVYFCFGAKPANSKFETKTAKKKVWILSFFTLKLPEEAKKIEIFPKFQRWMKKTNIFKCKPTECILLSETECHIRNNLLTEFARAVLGNIGPRSFFLRTSLCSARTVTSSGQYSPVRPWCSVSKRLIVRTLLLALLSSPIAQRNVWAATSKKKVHFLCLLRSLSSPDTMLFLPSPVFLSLSIFPCF